MRFRERLFVDGGSATTDRSNFSKIDDVRLGRGSKLSVDDAVVENRSALVEVDQGERKTNKGLLKT